MVWKACDSDLVFFDDVRKTKHFSSFDSIFFVALVNITSAEEKESIGVILLQIAELLEERRILYFVLSNLCLHICIYLIDVIFTLEDVPEADLLTAGDKLLDALIKIFNIEDEIRCAITQDFRRIIESGSASLSIFSELFADRTLTTDDNSIRMLHSEKLFNDKAHFLEMIKKKNI